MKKSFENNELLTWLDVERVLKKKTGMWSCFSNGIVSIECFYDGADVYYNGEESLVLLWFKEVFGGKFCEETKSVSLEIGGVGYCFECIFCEEGKVKKRSIYPLWKDIAYLGNEKNYNSLPPFNGLKAPKLFHFTLLKVV